MVHSEHDRNFHALHSQLSKVDQRVPRYFRLPVCLSVCVSVCVSICLSVCLSVRLSLSPYLVSCLSVRSSPNLSFCLTASDKQDYESLRIMNEFNPEPTDDEPFEIVEVSQVCVSTEYYVNGWDLLLTLTFCWS